jgi:hypothetical protein
VLGWQSPDALIDVVEWSANQPLAAPVPVTHFGDGSCSLNSLAVTRAGLRVVVLVDRTHRDHPNVNLKVWVAVRPPVGKWRSQAVGGRLEHSLDRRRVPTGSFAERAVARDVGSTRSASSIQCRCAPGIGPRGLVR